MTEMSTMSEMSSMESSAMEPAPAGGKVDDNSNRIFLALVLIAAILLIATIISAVRPKGAAHKVGNEGGSDDQDGNDRGPSYVPGQNPPPSGTATTKLMRSTTREVITTSPTPDEFVTNRNPKLWPPPPSAGSQNDTLLCVVGPNRVTSINMQKYPDDGLCDLTFYDDLMYLEKEFRGIENVVSWNNFKDAASRSNKTGYGISIYYSDAHIFYDAVFGSGYKKSMIKNYFDVNKIRHYGFLKAHGTEYLLKKSAGAKDGIGQLRLFRALATSWEATNTHIVIGVKFHSYEPSSFSAKAKALEYIISKTEATIAVLHTHVSAWSSANREAPLCMTSWTYLGKRTREPTLKDVGTDILARAVIPENVTIMVSFTMSAQIFKSAAVYHRTKSAFSVTAFGSLPYAQMCILKMPHSDLDANSDVYISSLDETFSFCAERAETIISKIKKWLEVVAPKKHGFAFFDVDLDDLANTCRKGSFYRIEQVKRYLRT